MSFDTGAGLEASVNGSLNAVGTEKNPIVMKGKSATKGFWAGVGFLSKSTKNKLSWVKLSDAGASGYHFRSYAVLVVGKAEITHSTVSNSTTGLIVDQGADISGYAANTFESIDDYPLVIGAGEAGALDSESKYANAGGKAFIALRGDKVPRSQTWAKQEVPYRLTQNAIAVADSDVVLTWAPGVEIAFEEGTGVDVDKGALSAVGTADDPIVLRGVDASKSYWGGIVFRSNASKNELAFVELSDGGASGHNFRTYGLLVIGRAKVSNSTFKNIGSDAAFVVDEGASIEGFAKNGFAANAGFPISLPAGLAGELDGESDFAGPSDAKNAKPWVYLTDKGHVKKTQTWRKQNVPYRVAGTPSINEASAVVTIEPGARFEFEEGKGLYVEKGALTAKGTSDAPIVFTGVDADLKGYWSGLYFLSNDSKNALEHVTVSGGGASGYNFGFYGVGAAGQLSISKSDIRDNGTRGLWIRKGASITPDTVAELRAQNTFANNGQSTNDDIVDER